MAQVAYQDAQQNLSELLKKASQGEDVIIEGEGRLQVQLVVIQPQRRTPRFGGAKGKIKILEGFDEPLDEVEW